MKRGKGGRRFTVKYYIFKILGMIGQTGKRAAVVDPRHCRII